MIRFLTLCVAFVALFTSNAFAKCETESKTIFACTTTKGKLIEVCDAREKIRYSFGSRNGKPAIVLNVPRKQATTHQWFGMKVVNEVTITNGATAYTVFIDEEGPYALNNDKDKQAEIERNVAGVRVELNGRYINTVYCNKKRNIVINIDGIDLESTPE